MKKIFSILLALITFVNLTPVLAEDTGIQIIGGPETVAEAVNLDDWKVGQTVDISGFGEVTLVSADFVDEIYIRTNQIWEERFASYSEAEYLRLVVEILNTQTVEVDFFKQIDNGICTFDDTYFFGTWKRQYESLNGYPYGDKDRSFSINPMYRGKYIIVATLPNDVVKSKKPLSITFKIGDSEFTYHHRK